MADRPSYKGLDPSFKTVLRTTPKSVEQTKRETQVTTQHPAPSTPSPRGHA